MSHWHVQVPRAGVSDLHLAICIREDGCKETLGLGLWLGDREGSKFWLSVLNDLKNRGVENILIAGGGRAERLSGGSGSGIG